MTKKLSLLFSVLILSFAFGYFIFAWTEPGSAPPGGNVPAPINVGSTAQTKTGDLTVGNNSGTDLTVQENLRVNGNIVLENDRDITGADIIQGYNDLRLFGNSAKTATIWLDSPVRVTKDFTAQSGVILGGVRRTSWPSVSESDTLQTVTNRGRVTTQTIRSPRFEDYNNTGFYADPASTSYFNNMRASIYYDRDNTGYYVNPAGSSRVANVYANYLRSYGSGRIDSNLDIGGDIRSVDEICLNNGCRRDWPSGGITSESDTLDSVSRRGKRTGVHLEVGRIYDLNTSYWIDMDGESRLNVVKIRGGLNMEADINLGGRKIRNGYLNRGWCYNKTVGKNGSWHCTNGYYMAGVRIDSWGQGISTGALYCCKL